MSRKIALICFVSLLVFSCQKKPAPVDASPTQAPVQAVSESSSSSAAIGSNTSGTTMIEAAQPSSSAAPVSTAAAIASAEPGATLSPQQLAEQEAARVRAEQARLDEAARLAEEARIAEEARLAEEARQREAARIAALQVPVPTVSVAGGVYASAVSLSLGMPVPEAKMIYTVDGSTPSRTKGIRYTGSPIKIQSSATLRVLAYVDGGQSSKLLLTEYSIAELCVAPNNSGDGRRGSPLGSIVEAAEKAVSLGITEIKLAAGTWNGSITITQSVRFSGGWNSSFSSRSSGSGSTVIQASEAASSSKTSPAFALRVTGASAEPRFEGIEFRGYEASYAAGVLVDAGSRPEFTDCLALGAFGSYGYGAVVLSGAKAVFSKCRLDGGEGATGFALSVDNAEATVESSWLNAGSGSVSGHGLVVIDGKVIIRNSVLAGNKSNVSYGAAFYNSRGSQLEQCTLIGGMGRDASAVFSSVSNPIIKNCVLWSAGNAKSYGIVANYGDSMPALISGSIFLGCDGGLFFDTGLKTAVSKLSAEGRLVSADGQNLGGSLSAGNVRGTFAPPAAPSWALPEGTKAGATLPRFNF